LSGAVFAKMQFVVLAVFQFSDMECSGLFTSLAFHAGRLSDKIVAN
jgi:hypothetical protein